MLITFFIAVIALLACTIWFISRPLAGKQAEATDVASVEQELIAIYQEKARHLRSQLEHKEISEEEFNEANAELETALAEELPESTAKNTSNKNDTALIISLIVILPIVSGALYLTLGEPNTLLNPNVTQAQTQEPGHLELDSMIAQLEQRLQQSPDDVAGWLMLGRSYTTLQRLDAAEQAYAEAAKRAADQPEVLMDHSEAIARANQNVFSDKAVAVLQQALKLEPQSRRGRWLNGIVALQQGKNELAITRWTELLNEPNIHPDERQLLEQFIAAANDKTAKPAKTAAAPGIEVSVTLADELKTQVNPNHTLFVYARAASGPPMPLAIKRLQAGQLPVTVRLDDSDAMMEQMRLSNFPQVIVMARISATGQAKTSSGDLLGASKTLNPATNNKVQIQINQVAP